VTSPRPDPFDRGDRIAIRSIREYGRHGLRVGHAVAGIVAEDTAEVQAVCTVAGSGMLTRAGRGTGPNGRQILEDDWRGEYADRVWEGESVVKVHRPGDPWSVWRWHDGHDWTGDWYGNLESPWARVAGGFDTQDWALDVVATGTPGTGDWSVRFKDEDELAYFVEHGAVSEGDAATVREAGERLAEIARAGSWPFDADWSPWIPDPAWLPIPLPDDITRL
jgi:hypothetical protein